MERDAVAFRFNFLIQRKITLIFHRIAKIAKTQANCLDKKGLFLYNQYLSGRTRKLYAQIAQSVEQWTENPRVAGSIPALGTKLHSHFPLFTGVVSVFYCQETKKVAEK